MNTTAAAHFIKTICPSWDENTYAAVGEGMCLPPQEAAQLRDILAQYPEDSYDMAEHEIAEYSVDWMMKWNEAAIDQLTR